LLPPLVLRTAVLPYVVLRNAVLHPVLPFAVQCLRAVMAADFCVGAVCLS